MTLLAHQKAVDIRQLKQYVLEHLPETAPLFQVLLSEKDVLTIKEYVVKAEVWWRLVDSGYDAKGLRNVGSVSKPICSSRVFRDAV